MLPDYSPNAIAEYAIQRRRSGKSLLASFTAAKLRLRPIIMTSFALLLIQFR
jgi:multidrug efflux pump subunit AcrB